MQLFFVGDSITLGVNDPDRLGWTGRVCRRLDPEGDRITAYNLGVRASTTRHIRERWRQEVYERVVRGTGSLLIFSFGAPDFANGLSSAQSLSNARNILGSASGEQRVIFICPPPMRNPQRDSSTKELADGFVELCRELDIPCLDLNYSLRQNGAYLDDIGRGDGVHPGKAGYGIMADMVYDFLSPFVTPLLD
ncbi:GDSL-type esterase/lipase family protein [Maridesulfovibrio sp. FT414]|uniref:GDSL-type esterase/lipase family protein n=1 Tax=Maridesulfovibrio sp. FT414 TaxID=2979469 RepID=UPI003D802EE0